MSSDVKEAKLAVHGPVFFLIQEQAKSVVAIQALQTRMAVLESLQERLMRAIEDVHRHLAASSAGQDRSSGTDPTRTPPVDKKADASGSPAPKPELTKSDSLNKDSGIGGSDGSLINDRTFLPDDEDELLQLLELIDQKSSILLKQVEEGSAAEGATETPTSSSSEMDRLSSARLLDNLLFEKVDAQRRLSEVRAERDELRQRLGELELATEAVSKQKTRVQQQLDATLVENQSLQEKIRAAPGCCDGSSNTPRRSESLGYIADAERASIRRRYLEYSEKSRLKVSGILKETSVLELQKQLLTYVMENDVLRAKLQQDSSARISRWYKIEGQLRKDLKAAVDEKQRLQEVVQCRELEIASLKDKIRSMEECDEEEEEDSSVRNFGMSSTDDWREPGVQNVYNKRSNLAAAASPFSPLGYGDFSKTQSLPAMLLLGAQAKLKDRDGGRPDFDHVYDTGSFTEVPLQYSSGHSSSHLHQQQQQGDHAKDLVDLSSPTDPNYSSTSTLVNAHFACQTALHCGGASAPNLSGLRSRESLQNWVFAPRRQQPRQVSRASSVGGARLASGHLCWKGAGARSGCHLSAASEDISSICTEFDPLSSDGSPSCENFVDSLNLSIPLKPVAPPPAVSQLSSIGDSLHSASLDMASASSPALYQDSTRRVLSARSVDGIRELLLESGYCKKRPPASPAYGGSNSSVATVRLGKSGRQVPVNIMNCMHESSDYSLL